MAKNKQLSLSDFGLDDDFGSISNFQGSKASNSRSPIMELGKVAAKGALSGAVEGNFIRQAIKKALPSGYGTALDFTDDAATSLKSLYNSASTEMRPLINDLKRTTDKLLPSMEKALPQWANDSLRKWSSSLDKEQKYKADDVERLQIEQAQKDIFQFEFKQRQTDRAEKKAKDSIKEGIDQARFGLMSKQLSVIAMASQQMADYQSKVTINYQRKALELQYRQYFIQRDSFEEQKRMNALTEEGLRGILHNTALPDYAKLTEKNRVGGFLRNQFAQQIGNTLNDRRAGFIKNLRGAVDQTVMSRVKNGIDMARMGLQTGESMFDNMKMMQEMAGEFGDDPNDLGLKGDAAKFAGSAAAQFGLSKLFGPMRAWLEKHPQVVKGGNTLDFMIGNLPQMAERFSRNRQGMGGINGKYAGVTDPIMQFFKDVAGRAVADPSKQLDKNTYQNLQAPSVYTNQANKSIVEVIPGYLAKILREIQVSRTGDESTPITSYDHSRGRFDTQRNVERTAFKGLFDEFSMRDTQARSDSILDDVQGAKKLSPAKRRLLQLELLRLNREGKVGDAETLANRNSYQGAAAKHAGEFATLFENHFKDDTVGAKRRAFSQDFRQLGASIEEKVAAIQDLANAGMMDSLVRSGIVTEDGKVDMQRYTALHLEQDPVAAALDEQVKKKRAARATAGAPRSSGKQRVTTMYEDAGLGSRTAHPEDSVEMEMSAQEIRNLQRRAGSKRAPGFRQSASSMHAPVNAGATPNLLQAFEASQAKLPEMLSSSQDRLHEDLLRIEVLLTKGIGVRRRAGALPEADSPESAEGGGFFDRSLRSHYDAARGFAQEKYHQGRAMAEEYGPKLYGQARDIAKERLEQLAEMRNKGWAKFKDTRNIFLKGEVMPRLMAAKLRAGEYVDVATGKVIESYKDIRGAVKDITLDEIVLTAEEAKSAFVRYGPVQKLITALGAVIKSGQQFAGMAGNYLQGLHATIVNTARQGIAKAKDYLDGPQDIYTKGDFSTPALFARIMKNGGYRLKNDPSKIVMKVTDINGPIEDTDGNEVLSRADLVAGLFDRFGRPIQTGWMRAMQMGKDYLNKGVTFAKDKLNQGLSMAKDAGQSAMRSGKQALAKVGDWWVANDGLIISGSKTMLDRLTEIRDLLNKRLPGEKHVFGDVDGDGLRDGSSQEIRKRREAAREEGLKETEEKDIDQALGTKGKLYAALSGLGSKINGAATAAAGKGSSIWQDAAGNLVSDAAEGVLGKGKRLLGRGIGAAGKGLEKLGLGRLGGFAGRMGGLVSGAEAAAAAKGMAGLGADAAEAGLGAAGAAGLKGLGGAARVLGAPGRIATSLAGKGLSAAPGLLGKAAMMAPGLAWGATKGIAKGASWLLNARKMGGPLGFLLGGAGDMVGGGIMSGLGAAAGGVGSLIAAGLASPFVLALGGAAALGAATYGGVKLYQHFANQKHLDAINTLRYVQYGFSPSDKDHLQAVMGLEDKLNDSVIFPTGGMAQLDTKKLVVGDLLDLFGIDKTDNDAIHNFAHWLMARFKPVFLTHVSVMHRLSGNKDLSQFDKLKPDQKAAYINGAKYPGGPYTDMVSPFPDLKQLVSGPEEVAKAATAALASFKGKAEDPTKKGLTKGIAAVAAAPKMGTGAIVHPGGMDPATMPLPDEVAQSSADVAKQLKAAGVDAVGNKLPSGTTGKSAIIASASAAPGAAVNTASALDPMTCVRMKAYGLTAMDPAKVQSLLTLESLIYKGTAISRAQPKDAKQKTFGMSADEHVVRTVTFAGDPMRLLSQVESSFDVMGSTGDAANNWLRWLMWRMLPTYLNYLSTLYTQTNIETQGEAERKMKGNAQMAVMVAQAVADSKQPAQQGSASIWRASTSPWKGYSLNGDAASVKENIQALKKAASGKAHLTETKAAVAKDPKAGGANTSSAQPKKENSLWGSISNTVSKAWDSAKSTVSNAWEGVKTNVSHAASAIGSGIKTQVASQWEGAKRVGTAIGNLGSSAVSGVGNAIASIGKGLGGKAATLPDPKGSGSWGALKDLITGAAQMVGVDPKLMGTMAAIESGFKWNAKAGTSSATGLYQFISSTWNNMIKKYGAQFGIPPGTPPSDPKANAIMGAQYVKENAAILTSKLKRPLTDTDIYAAHFLGPGGAVQLLTADPNANAVQLMPSAASANRNIFTENGQPRTVGQVIGYLNNLVSNRGRQFGVGGGTPSPTMGQGGTKDAGKAGTDGKGAASTSPAASVTPAAMASAPAASGGGATTSTLAQAKAVQNVAPSSTATPASSTKNAVPVASTTPGMPSSASVSMGGFSSDAGLAATTAKANQTPTLTQDSGVHQDQLKTMQSVDATLKQILTQVMALSQGKGSGSTSPTPTPSTPASSSLGPARDAPSGILNNAKASFMRRA